MGEQKVSIAKNQADLQKFVRYLLNDVKALEYLIANDMFETDIVRIGAEQEICLVDAKTYKPMCINKEVIAKMGNPEWLDTELAKFNLETNMTPREFTGNCLSQMEQETLTYLNKIREAVHSLKGHVVLAGILPTLRKFHLELENLTDNPRYLGLMKAIQSQLLLGSAFELNLKGIDELHIKHDSPLLEACNTSFQVHLQVAPQDFVSMYNIAQTLAAPIMAISANSSLLFGKRLWHETRIALFQQALDTRTSHDHLRERSPRVNFGNDWLQNSILDIYREDIARFRVLMTANEREDSLEKIRENIVPKLKALQVHNSTIYRWNRPCYGISPNGKPHLRIENRVLPAGPTVVDEIANAAFWLGAMTGIKDAGVRVTEELAWEDVRDNFMKAAQFGIDSNFNWRGDGVKITARKLILKELLPIAREGLKNRKVDEADIDRYLGIIEERAKQHMNGARWQLRAFTNLKKTTTTDEATAVLTAAIIKNQEIELPVHAWKLPDAGELEEYVPSRLKVTEFMTTDLFTVQKDDIIDLVTEMMDWRKIRYMPVEDAKGRLVGLVTSRLLLRHYSQCWNLNEKKITSVKDIMIASPITIGPKGTILEAINLMRDNKIGCLPVVQGDDHELIGIITEMDYLRISTRLMERLEAKK
ncbi:MAG: CBS domain-containing protein [Saprospiraceae bacterium]|nr:MAG: CBS domain-containing protein [Saprospiraceae bacterium]